MGYDSRNIKDVRFGSIQAKALYLGNVLIWPLGPTPIPTTYTRLEYIKTDDTAYLDVGEPIYTDGMTDPNEFFTYGFDVDFAPECPAVISGSGADMYLGINGYGWASGIPLGIQNLDQPGNEIWVCPYPDHSTRAIIGKRITVGFDRTYIGDEANDIHSTTRSYIGSESFDAVVTYTARGGESTPNDPRYPDAEHASMDGLPYRWTLSTQDCVHDPNENMPGKYYEFRQYDIDASGNRTLVATSYPVRKSDGTVNAYGLYTVYADGSEGQFVPFGGSSAGVQLGPDYSPNVHTVYIPTVAYAQRDCHLFDDGTYKFAYSDRDLITYYPAGSYSTADGDRIVVNADGTWDYVAPPEYIELEWISSGTHNDYLAIDTGVVACNQYRMVADVQWNAHNTQVQRFGSQWFTSSGDYYTYAFGTTESGWSINSGYSTSTGKWSVSSSRDTNRHVFDMQYYSPYLAKFDSQTKNIPNTGTAQPPSDLCTVHLFGRSRWTGTGIERDNYCSCKLYSCQIYDQSGNLVRDFVPAKFADDTVGMYDKVEGVQYLSWNTSSFEPGPEKVTGVTFNYVNGAASSTTLYLYNSKLYADATMSTPASAGTYVNASYRYVVVSGGSFTYETYSTVTTTTPAATLYLTASKAYSNPGMTTYPAAGEYANNDWKYVVASDGSYTKEHVTPTGDYIELEYINFPEGAQLDFTTSFNAASGSTYRIDFDYAPDASGLTYIGAGFYNPSDDEFYLGAGYGAGVGVPVVWGKGWSTAASSASTPVGTLKTWSLSFNNSAGVSLSIDGVTNTWGPNNFNITNWGVFHLDGCSASGSVTGDGTLRGRYGNVSEYMDGVLVRSYIPAKSLDGTKVGFYEVATDTWLLPSAGSVTPGPEA